MLLIFGGLPGTGKSTIARLLAARLGAVWLRIDSIEQALIRAETVTRHDIGPAGYLAAYAIAADNLRLGNVVIADAVNPIAITRQAWRGRDRECRALSGDRSDLLQPNAASVSRGKPRSGHSRPYPAGLAKGHHP